MDDHSIVSRIQRVRCWNCRKIVVIPFPLDLSTVPPTYIIPYRIECPVCGDSIYKYMCRDESQFVH